MPWGTAPEPVVGEERRLLRRFDEPLLQELDDAGAMTLEQLAGSSSVRDPALVRRWWDHALLSGLLDQAAPDMPAHARLSADGQKRLHDAKRGPSSALTSVMRERGLPIAGVALAALALWASTAPLDKRSIQIAVGSSLGIFIIAGILIYGTSLFLEGVAALLRELRRKRNLEGHARAAALADGPVDLTPVNGTAAADDGASPHLAEVDRSVRGNANDPGPAPIASDPSSSR